MAISTRDRRTLWARSGNLCAKCKKQLTKDVSKDQPLVIGEECHIVASSVNGPRGNDPLPLTSRDRYENLILLCRDDHAEIDKFPDLYTVDKLKRMKSDHETWVKNNLQSKTKVDQAHTVIKLPLVEDAKGLIEFAITAHDMVSDFPVPQNDEESTLIGTFFKELENLSLSNDDMEYVVASSLRIRTRLAELELRELFVYSAMVKGSIVAQLQR